MVSRPDSKPDFSLHQQIREQLLANRGVDRGGRGFDRNVGLELPALREVLAQTGADLHRRRIVEGVAGELHLAVGHHQRTGR